MEIEKLKHTEYTIDGNDYMFFECTAFYEELGETLPSIVIRRDMGGFYDYSIVVYSGLPEDVEEASRIIEDEYFYYSFDYSGDVIYVE